MSLFKQFKMDAVKEQDGVLVQYGANADGSIPGFRILRRSASNQRFTKSLERETAPYRRMIELNTLDPMQGNHIFMRVFCLSILIGWENVLDESNTPIVFTVDNAIKLFQLLPELYDDLFNQSSKVSLFREETSETDAKN